MKAYKRVRTCPISKSKESINYLDFGDMPLVNNLNNTRKESINCARYPLSIDYYPKSKLSMLSVVVKPEILFSHYLYKSGTSKPYIEHCKSMYDHITKFVKVEPFDRFIDIGGNDGTLLETFLQKSNGIIAPINVDPSKNLKEISEKKGIVTVTDLWNSDVAVNLAVPKKAKVITSTNVFQHTQPIRDFVKGISKALADDGVWCLEFPYWRKDLETNQYDQAYHEHIYYYLLTPLFDLFLQEELKIIDVSEQTIHGGTLRVISRKENDDDMHAQEIDSVKRILVEESKFDEKFYNDWGNAIHNHISETKTFLLDLKKKGYKIAGFGAAAKGCTFLNASMIDYKIIDYIVDDTDTKQGKFVPGTGIEIVDRQHLVNNPPDYILILAHNFAEYITKSLRPIYKGKFITVFPKPVIYE